MMEIVSSLGRRGVVNVINISEYCTSLRLVAIAWARGTIRSKAITAG